MLEVHPGWSKSELATHLKTALDQDVVQSRREHPFRHPAHG
jgi:hypothetical protein